jgi:hypothetical protein
MSTKSRQTIYGGAIVGARIRAESAREAAKKAIRAVSCESARFLPLLRKDPFNR